MAQLKDLIVNGASRFIGDIYGGAATLSGNLLPTTNDTQYLGDSTHKWKFVGTLTGNADSATKVNHSITIGNYPAFDGSANVTIPIYNGET